MDRITIKNTLEKLMQEMCARLTFPAIALTTRTINDQFMYRHKTKPNIPLIKDIATTELGWEFRILSDRYAQGPALVKTLEPNMEHLTGELKRLTDTNYLSLRYLKSCGLNAAFNYNVTSDPEGIISETTWAAILDELGFIYEPDNEYLITKTLELPANAQEQMEEVLAELPLTFREPSRRTNFKKVKVLVEAELRKELGKKWGRISNHQWESLLKKELGEHLVLAGYSLKKEWVYKEETNPQLRKPDNIFLPAQIIRNATTKPDQFAKGFPIHIPACICDGTTIVYLELLGPRQAVKANWAAIRGGKSTYITGLGTVMAKKEDGFSTLKTTLKECGWDHWCLIHGQASIKSMVPETEFYIVDKTGDSIPANFYPQLAKALPFPVLPHWTEYLWVQGRMNDLITALGGIGLGGWKVFFIKEKWEQIVSSGLSQGKIKINHYKPNEVGVERKLNRVQTSATQLEEPFFRLMRNSLFDDSLLDEQQITQLVNLTQQVYLIIERESKSINFWDSVSARNKLGSLIQKCLLSPPFIKIPGLVQKRTHLINRIMEFAKKNNDKYAPLRTATENQN